MKEIVGINKKSSMQNTNSNIRPSTSHTNTKQTKQNHKLTNLTRQLSQLL